MDDGSEQRKYARIEASIACSVATATDAFEAAVTNLSKGGAGIFGPDGAAAPGDKVTLMLERAEGLVTLSVPGTVVRVEHRGERTLYGVQFEPLPPDEEKQLELLLQLISGGKGQGRRAHPRVAARLDVNCRTEAIFRGFLSDLSRGGMSVKTLREVEVGEEMKISFGVPNLKGLVEVTGTVVDSQKLPHGFRLGVHFTPLSDEEREQVNRTVDVLLGIGLPDAEVLADDDDDEKAG
ncbi:MAG: PilZ domain-containing protein [Archangiaceae bacterium]|nr:PilZ domain-containing protein [Archangiaceae bacterium]